jgi:hypothetical protein
MICEKCGQEYPDLKIGDMVEFTGSDSFSVQAVGARAIIVHVTSNYYYIKWCDLKGTGKRLQQSDGGYSRALLKLVERYQGSPWSTAGD